MNKITFILRPLPLLVVLFIPASSESAAEKLAAVLRKRDATLSGIWTVTEYQEKSNENYD